MYTSVALVQGVLVVLIDSSSSYNDISFFLLPSNDMSFPLT